MAKQSAGQGLSEKNKRTIIIIAAAVLVVGGGWYIYDALTVVPPPKLESNVQPQQVAEFLGNRKGFIRMTVDDRENYMRQINDRYCTNPETRTQFVQSLARLSSGEKQVLMDASFEVAKTRVVEKAREYNKITQPAKRKAFVDSVIREANTMRRDLGSHGGGTSNAGGPTMNVGEPFKEAMPTSTDEWMKIVTDRTTAQDRAEARDFVEQYTARQKEIKNNPSERARFEAVGR